MTAVLSEFISYIIKFAAMVVLAGAGIAVGGKLRKRKNEKMLAEEQAKQ